LNRRITETYPDAAPNTKSFTYDAVGNLVTRTDQEGQVQTHVYDDLYRLLSRSTPGWVADTFTYDVGGRMLSATRDTWVVTYTYDVANRVVQTTQGGRTIGYAYDIPNGTRTITYPGGRVITEQQDLRSRLSGVKEGAVNIATYSYDNGNRVDSRTYNNGVVADYTYDANNRITSLTHDLGATLIAGFTHAYDNEGNKKYEEQQHNPTRSEGYQYDSIYRLVDYKVGALVAGTVPVPTTQTAYNLDAVGNWDSKTTDAVTENRTHNAANEITAIDATAITSDDNGNLIQDANFNYTFDENNRLVLVEQASVPVASYSYDALGRRISKVVGSSTTVFLYDNARIIEERDGSNNVQATYTYGNYIDEVLTKDAGANKYYYHQNTLWSVHALTDATAAVVERYTYDAYGAPQILTSAFGPLTSSAFGNRFMFTGREWDAECSLYHYRARTYGPGLGRFYSCDPLGYVDGMNLYEYVRGRISHYTDPLGKMSLIPWFPLNPPALPPLPPSQWIPSPFSICRRDFAGKGIVWDCLNALGGQHTYVQLKYTITPDMIEALQGWGFDGTNKVTEEKQFKPNSCKSCKLNGGILKYGYGTGKPSTNADTVELKDCIRNYPPSKPYSTTTPPIYICSDWAYEAVAACGLTCK
jgi:RHS repeat-associated protein